MHIKEEKRIQTKMTNKYFQKILIFISLFYFHQNCDPGYSTWVKKESIHGFNCKDTERTLVLIEKSLHVDEPSDSKGRITGIGSSQIHIQIDNAKKRIIEYNNVEIVYLVSGALGALPEWAQLKILCPSSGQVVFDSGVIKQEEAYCSPSNGKPFGRSYWFFGLKDGFDKESCCPNGYDCKKFLNKE
jgi:hypothetical protein